MSLYECVFLVRQDISSAEVDKITENFSKIATDFNGSVIKTEYWGLRNLAYEINNNRKAHYIMLGLEGSSEGINEIKRKAKLNENVIRAVAIAVEEISSEPSAILKSNRHEVQEVINVTEPVANSH